MVAVKSRSKSLKDTEVTIDNNSTLETVLGAISKNNKGISKYRLRVSYLKESKQVPITEESFFKDGNNNDIELFVKDLGPQISWRLVFVIEYFGPLLVHAIVYYLSLNPKFMSKYGTSKVSNVDPALNKIAFFMVMGHYLKREIETLFVHKFTLATMPLFNVFKNSFHYWILNGIISLGYLGYGFVVPNCCYEKALNYVGLNNLNTLVSLFILSEAWNAYIHIRLRIFGDQQRKIGNNTKRVPISSGIFKIFVAPNYTFEVWSWIWFALAFKLNLFAVFFVTVSATQMYLWAMKKNRRYGTKRSFIIPFIF
ncbi:similar to Saccharomyces cerevisiae YDL015C TSC13 Enoyl reductase that catalyzes the last step in each cycle of very long chain fatty acid elongation [Maudiozyma saulgeensis]|uniref:Similar to Saccharomyces cerevisiae YDL015C TSC13 Enoyl reductase that catalyzes the last step in each cycle of very long chain fatty acid elongation n=1 Tax=Maudiozyma saulgeensis TaxID=1789683 RepID=A0A1X7R3K8_9SACH|nr:similar to Saccharomyces cerevisiae YDL015C TSC13 Enoyl reductase that catalyzes the last step in each cycle of very long chain fatty acid elongation [Kazachstania saulgeensis]